MHPPAPPHPTDADLTAFALGKLVDASVDTVRTHLATCTTCQDVVASTPPDSFVELLRGAGAERVSSPQAATATTPPAETRDTLPQTPQVGTADLPAELRDHSRYRVLGRLGKGGMGVVYQAEHRLMERLVAVKVVAPALVDNAEAVERFKREVRAAAKLDHPNIIKAHDAEQAGSLHLFVMEYAEGRDLHDVLAKKGPLPVANACNYVRQAALGLQHAHEKGMVHRDLKPQNLMLTTSGAIKILDFGLAKLLSETRRAGALTQDNVVMGTPEYLAPEQARDTKAADVRADLYSLGCTLFCLLTGRPPFTGDNALQVIMAHVEKSPPRLDELRPDVPPELAALVARLLDKDPARRLQTPKELAEALRPFAKVKAPPTRAPVKQTEATPFVGMEVTPTRPVARPAARPQRWIIATVALGLLAFGSIVAGIVMTFPTKNGVVTLEVEPADAEVVAEDGKITVTRRGDKEPYTITVAEGGGTLKIQKAGFEIKTREVSLSDKGQTIRVRLDQVPIAPALAATPVPVTGRAVALTGGRWRIDGREVVQESLADMATLHFGDAGWTSYDFEYEFQVTSGTRVIAGHVRRGTPGRGFTYYVGYDRNRQQVLATLENDVVKEKFGFRDLTVDFGRWYRVRIETRADWLRCLLDGQEVFHVRRPENPAGGVAIHTLGTAARFRNIKVTSPDGRTLWDGVPELPAGSPYVAESNTPPPVSAAVAPEARNPPSDPAPRREADGFVSMFNGKDLTGWKTHPSQERGWRVRDDGVLVGSGPVSHLYSERGDYANVHVRAEVRINDGGNGGLYVRSSFGPRVPAGRAAFPQGYEAQINSNSKDPNKTGALYVSTSQFMHSFAGRGGAVPPPGTWFRLEIIADDNRIVIKVDGKETLNRVDPGRSHQRGHIALQVHDPVSQVEFRKIEVKELP